MTDGSGSAKTKRQIGEQGLISVIIPVFNVEEYLRKCIRSVQNNTYKNLEIICIDDGSTDQCGAILDRMASEDARIRVIHQSNQGVAAARNTGMKAAAGEFIVFIDSDDFVHPRYFESLLGCITETDADLAVCGCLKIIDKKTAAGIKTYHQIKYRKISDREFSEQYYTRHMVWARLYRRKYLCHIRFSGDVRLAEDTLFNLCAAASIEKPAVYETDAAMYYYRVRPASITYDNCNEDPKWMIDTGRWYLAHREMILRSYSGDWSWLLFMQIIKATLSYRHMARYILRSQDKVRQADRILRMAFRDLRRTKKITVKEHVILLAMIRSAWMYRLFRIIQDPTMLDWERTQRRK